MTRKELAEKRAQLVAALEAITTHAVDESRGLTDDEKTQRADLRSQIEAVDERDAELEAQEKRTAAADDTRVQTGDTNTDVTARARVTNEPAVYRRGGEHSWFGDMARVQRHDATASAAAERLVRGSQQAAEQRAIDLTTTAGTGGEFAPPAWIIDEFVKLARAGRVTADLIGARTLPSGVSSVNLPKVATGTATAVQAAQGNAVQDTALTTTSVSSGIRTIAGQQTVSLQLLEQSGINFDDVVLGDLAADYAVQLDTNTLNANDATYKGILNVASIGAVTYTDASPAVAGAGKFYAQVAKALQTVSTTRFLPPTAIVMHPRRWAWVTAAFDANNRPLVVPSGAGFNVAGTQDGGPEAQGPVGQMHGLPVYTDPNIPTNLGAGTNQDIVIVLREADLNLYETPLVSASFDATYAGSLQMLYRVHAYSAFIGGRYPASICTIGGTGLITPAF